MGDRALRIKPLSAVGEAVGRYVENAHDDGTIEIKPCPRRPRGREDRELLSHPRREARARTGNPFLELGYRRRHRNGAPVGPETQGRYQTKRQARTGQRPGVGGGNRLLSGAAADQAQRTQPKTVGADAVQLRPADLQCPSPLSNIVSMMVHRA